MNEQNNQHHYFATTAFHWAIGDTRQEAIENVARRAGASIIKEQVKAQGGMYCWSAKVLLPRGAQYAINNYMPQVNPMELAEAREFSIVKADGSVKVRD